MKNSLVTIDTLRLLVKYPRKDIYDNWRRRKEKIKSYHPYQHEILLDDFVLSRGEYGYKLCLSKNNARVYLSDRDDEIAGAGMGSGVLIELGPDFLTENMVNLQQAVTDLLLLIGITEHYPIHVTRIDLAVDMFGIEMKEVIVDHWRNALVGRTGVTSAFYNQQTGDLETIYVGKRGSPITLRAYDKVAKAAKDGTLEFWRPLWCNYAGPVMRLEWQINPKEGNFSSTLRCFDELNDNTIKTLLNYLVDWVRLCIPSSSETNRARWKDDPLWERLRSIVADWSGEITWTISRPKKQYRGVTKGYLKSSLGHLSGLIARISPEDPTILGLTKNLQKLGISVEEVNKKAEEKARINMTK